MNSLQQRARFDAFVHEFNADRLHEALGMKPPVNLYERPRDPMETCRRWNIPFTTETFSSSPAAASACTERKNNLSTVLAGQRPAIKQVDDGIWLISFILVDPEGVASAMAPTMLHVGNAVGMALLIAIANRHVGGLSDDTLKIAVADGIQVAYWLAAAGETKMKSGRRAGQISAMSLSLPG